ncbi:MAG: hypothetical protein KGK34_06315 [Chloroflexota bacterium]|nr:hypothetical protein [Chloroflexota bacterium]
MRRDPQKEEEGPRPLAVGIALGLWISLMILLAFVLVPLLFSRCAPPVPS